MQEEPFVKEVENSNGEPSVAGKRYEGYCIDLLKELARKVDFDYTLHVHQNGYGSLQPDGTWDGMVGELVNKVGLGSICLFVKSVCPSVLLTYFGLLHRPSTTFRQST